MNWKKLALIGVLALVVLGCVLAAGCTSTTTTQQTTSGDAIAGNWSFSYEENGTTGIGLDIIKNDGTGFFVVTTNDGDRLVKYLPFTWKNNNDGTYTFRATLENTVVTMKYSSAEDTFTDPKNTIHRRMDPITGIWFTSVSADRNGGSVKSTHVLYSDGTGRMYDQYADGTAKVAQSKWVKNADGTYTITISDGESATLKLDSATGKLSTGSGIEFTKKFDDSYYYLSILGPWHDMNGKFIIFNADGTYASYQNGEKVGEGTWDIPEFGKFALHVKKGVTAAGEDISGKERTWTYDRENDTFTSQAGTVYIRPAASMDGLSLTGFSTAKTSEKCPIIGSWSGTYTGSTNTYEAVQTINADGTGNWILLTDTPQIKVYYESTSSFDKTNWSGTFDKESSDGKTYTMVYDPTEKTLTETGPEMEKVIYTKTDPISGIWFSDYVNEKKNHLRSTLLMLNNGTGYCAVLTDNGTVEAVSFTWKKNADGTYAIIYHDGESRTITMNDANNILTSSSGAAIQKISDIDSKSLNVLGPWYNKESNVLIMINADGTGTVYDGDEKQLSQFTWTVPESGKINVHFLNGVSESSGENISGKDSVWTYDNSTGTITTSIGKKYLHPTESIKDLFTLH